jgi:tryptophan synthase alpha subunit
MTKLEKHLEKIKQQKRIGLMTHAVIGYPSLEDTEKIVLACIEGGADLIELQIPFSDPLADGPTIMQACEHALAQETKVSDAFSIIKKLTNKTKVPLLIMAYYNTVFRYGTEKFCVDAGKAGAAGLIVPDMNIDEEQNEHFNKFTTKYNLSNIRVISPASTKERLKLNAENAQGFVYYTAQQGITGARQDLPSELSSYLETVKRCIKIPLAVGFGISKPEHMQALKGQADIAVVGSAIINVIKNTSAKNREKEIKNFIQQLTFNEKRIY